MNTDNRLIAEFMGHPLYYKQVRHRSGGGYSPPRTKMHKLLYHKSWSWLMPVIEKIEELSNGVEIYSKYCIIDFDNVTRHSSGVCKSKLEAVYKASVEFIKWYNIKECPENSISK